MSNRILKTNWTYDLQQDVDAGFHGEILLSIRRRIKLEQPEQFAPYKNIKEQDIMDVISAAMSLYLENKRNKQFNKYHDDKKIYFDKVMENIFSKRR